MGAVEIRSDISPEPPVERAADGLIGGRWRLGAVLGRGGMATVFAATHRNGSRVAIKILHPQIAREPESLARFVKEGYVGNLVEHPGAVQTFDDGVLEDGRPFLVMERLDGETLVSRLARACETGLPLAEVTRVTCAVLAVLGSAHARGIIHRDVKPENVFITSDGRIKLLDFGIARSAQVGHGETLTGMAMGTPAYMPPEQARGRWDLVDHRSDLWAVGAMFFHAITGRGLRTEGTPTEQLLQAMSPCPPALALSPGLAAPLAAFLDRALAAEPAARFQSAREMSAALEAAAASTEHRMSPGATAVVRRPTLQLSLSQFLSPRVPTVIVSAAAGAALLSAILLVVVGLRAQARPPQTVTLPPVPVATGSAQTLPAIIEPKPRASIELAAPPSTAPPSSPKVEMPARAPRSAPSAKSARSDPRDLMDGRF